MNPSPGIPLDEHAATGQTTGLVQVPADTAREAGFLIPVALTARAHADCVAWTDADAARTGAIQDEDGRMIDVLAMAANAIRSARRNGRPSGPGWFPFRVCRVARDARPGPDGDIEPEEVPLILTLAPAGFGILNGTISFPDET
ncbi:hypothetical protein [Actinomadura violacea]|uniref:Uncharacterized protein n=1 Tax=Actinomadura violacea TaxID=2819934 RepID=A0ABS3S4Q9_9ACTN|nr:hypothetical protein [Actinomadura violacea]MBO2463999.1 hypothetical protein [Actinomadura violacea]